MDFSQWYGLAGIPLVQQVTKIIGFKGVWAVLTSLIVAVVLNAVIALVAGNNIVQAVGIGVLTGFGSNFYNDLRQTLSK